MGFRPGDCLYKVDSVSEFPSASLVLVRTKVMDPIVFRILSFFAGILPASLC